MPVYLLELTERDKHVEQNAKILCKLNSPENDVGPAFHKESGRGFVIAPAPPPLDQLFQPKRPLLHSSLITA